MSLQIILKNSSVSGKEPTASQLASGELALNYHADGPFISCKDTAGVVRRIAGVWISTTAPSSPQPGEFWLDTNTDPAKLKVYKDGTDTWIETITVVAASTTAAGVVELATNAETQAGSLANRAVTPASLQSKVSDSTSTTSSTTIASSTAVKSAKDVADAALPAAGGTISGNLIVSGNLTVNGTTTTIDTETLEVEDKNIEMGVVDTPTDTTADGGGITLKGATDKTLNWVNSTDSWTSSENVNLASGKTYKIAGTNVLSATALGSAVQISSDNIPDGTVTNADLAGSIADTKLSTISTAGKVSNSATTATDANTANAIVARDASGNFSAGTITASLSGNASTVTTNANLTGDVTSVGNATSIAAGVIVNNDVNASAAIAGTKISADFGAQNLTVDTNVLHVDASNDRVGVGTASPAYLLEVEGTGDNSAVIAVNETGTGNPFLFTQSTTENLITSESGLPVVIQPRSTEDIVFKRGSSESARIDSSGNVGIGTTSPSGILHLSTTGTTRFFIEGSDGMSEIRANNGNLSLFTNQGADANGANNTIFYRNGSNESMRIDSSGRLLVGTSSDITGSSNNSISLVDTGRPIFSLGRNDSTVAADVVIADIKFYGTGGDGSTWEECASIKAEADGTHATGDKPSRLVFSSTADGSSTPTERMRIDSSGNVGIGTTSPAEPLHIANVVPVIRFEDTNNSNALLDISGSAGDCRIDIDPTGLYSSSRFSVDIDGTERARIDSSGNVGIGTTSPSVALHIAKSGTAQFRLEDLDTANAYSNVSASNGNFVIQADPQNVSGSTRIGFEIDGSEKGRLDSDGRLLLGTTSAWAVGNADLLGIQSVFGGNVDLRRDDASVVAGNSLGAVRFWGNTGDSGEAARIEGEADGTHATGDKPGRLLFLTTPAGSDTPVEQMRIDNVGNVGIGTGSPAQLLHVSDTSKSAAIGLRVQNAEGHADFFANAAGVRIDCDSVTSAIVLNDLGRMFSTPTYSNTSTATTNYLRIASSGLIYRSTSSIAYKTDVEDMDDAYADAILNLRPVWYRSTCEGDNPDHSHWGFIAEEVEQVDPRLCSFKDVEVTQDEAGNNVVTPLDTPVVDGVDYASLTPLLLNLIKRQKTQIEALEARLNAAGL